jgi:hypothetical protein
MNNREKNLMLLKKAAEGKLTADDLVYDPDNPTFDICLNLGNEDGTSCRDKNPLSEKEIQRLKAKGQYFDITLNLNA